MSHRLPFVIAPAPPCPACGDVHTVRATAAAALWEVTQPGDLVWCLECNAVAVVLTGGALRLFDVTDFDDYNLADLAHVTAAVLQMRTVYSRRN